MDPVAAFLFGLRARGIRPGLGPTRAALDALGAPDRAFPIVQVAGSVGKGSTATVAASIARAAGLKVGLFTSPHLVRFSERFVVDGRQVGDEEIAAAVERIRRDVPWAAGEGAGAEAISRSGMKAGTPASLRPLTFFEWCTILACVLFRDAEVDLAVLEVGLGGRWDATTACRADVTAISRIDLEHTEILGTSIAAVAAEKGGVLRAGVPAVTVAQPEAALDVLEAQAAAVGTHLWAVGREVTVAPVASGGFDYRGPALEVGGCAPGLVGRHQVENAALAMAALEALWAGDGLGPVPVRGDALGEAMREGVAMASLPGRFEALEAGVWLDGAHTRAAMAALAETIAERLPGGRAHLVFAALRGKPVADLLSALEPVAASLTLTEAGGDRAQDPEAYADVVARWAVPMAVERNPGRAVARARERAGAEAVVVCGSLYLVGEVRAACSGVHAEPGDPSTVDPERGRRGLARNPQRMRG
jgi:dihydrofolate synthase / folylpolyglutamate synthase